MPLSFEKPIPFLKLSVTGVFMGLANLVPGVSGGTMVLALGLYDEFIGAMSDLTRLAGRIVKDGALPALQWFARSAVVLALLFGISAVTIGGLATLIEYLMAMFQPGMLALFIGMTLGGAPMLWRDLKPLDGPSIGGFIAGFTIMALLAVLRPGGGDPGFLLFFIGGVVASSSMILPGISGSYMLLILGLYIPVISGVSDGVHALREGDLDTVIQLGLVIGLPVGAGLLIGIVGFSNLIRYCLEKFHKPTVGFLMGLLIGSVLGLYPFQTTSLAKLPRYANDGVLTIAGYGWETAEGDPVYDALEELQRDGLTVEYLPVRERAPEMADVETARSEGAVMVVYGELVEREVRRAAAEETDTIQEVELVFIPNSERTTGKTFLVLALIGIGFGITLTLGRLGGEKEKKDQASTG